MFGVFLEAVGLGRLFEAVGIFIGMGSFIFLFMRLFEDLRYFFYLLGIFGD